MKRGPKRKTLTERFWVKVDMREWEPGDCWEWTAQVNAAGYGNIAAPGKHGKPLLAHRVAYELFYGPIPNDGPSPFGWIVLHSCDNPGCVNPSHLRLGDHAANSRDARSRNRLALGVRCGSSKLQPKQVAEIRALYAAGGTSHSKLARQFGVNHVTIHKVVTRKTWRHIA